MARSAIALLLVPLSAAAACTAVPVPEAPAPRAERLEVDAPSAAYFAAGLLMPGYAESDAFLRTWYAEQLAAMGESPLPRLAQPAWRFLWLRTFDPAIAVRVESTSADGGARLVATWLSGMGGYEPGHVVRRHEVWLTKDQWTPLRADLVGLRLERMPPVTEDDFAMFDGALWILEQWCGDRHAVVQRQSPSPPSRLRAACLALLQAADWNVRDAEIY